MPTIMTINTHEAKTKLIELLRKIELHRTPVLIYRNGKPIAYIVSIEKVADPLKQHK